MVNGIDVSDYQPDVDWKAVHDAGYSFTYCKATEGTSYVAQTYHENIANANAAGMLFGAYHMYHFDADPVEQARHFLETAISPVIASARVKMLPPALDLELSTFQQPQRAVLNIAKFLGAVEHAIGARMVLYMAWGWWNSDLGGSDDFTGHPLWVAQYQYSAKEGESPRQFPWLRGWPWTFWQHTDKLAVPGIAGPVDADWFNGSLDELNALCLKGDAGA